MLLFCGVRADRAHAGTERGKCALIGLHLTLRSQRKESCTLCRRKFGAVVAAKMFWRPAAAYGAEATAAWCTESPSEEALSGHALGQP
jgi:hypothetical protein